MTGPGSLRTGWLLVRMRVRRTLNQIGALNRRKPGTSGARTGTGPARGSGAGVVLALLMFAFFQWQAVMSVSVVQSLYTWDAAALAHFTLQGTLMLLAAVFVPLGNKDITGTEWDLEWLVTLPIGTRALVATRIVERTIVNHVGLIAVVPWAIALAAEGASGIVAPVGGALLAFLVLAIAGTLQTVIDTGLRVRFAPSTVRNAQAVFPILGLIAFYLAFTGAASRGRWLSELAVFAPPWLEWTPVGLAARLALRGMDAGALSMLVAQVAAVVLLGHAAVSRLIRHGVASGGVREAARVRPAVAAPAPSGGLLSAVQRREVRLLLRDRTFLVQTMVTPLLIIGLQVMVQGGGSRRGLGPEHLAAMAFGAAAYMVMFSAFQSVNTEGGALWLLYTVPRSVGRVLREKAQLWAALATVLAITVVAVGGWRSLSPRLLILALIAVAGVPVYTLVATALGVFAYRPGAEGDVRKIRPTYAYLYMVLASFYTYAIYASRFSQRLALMMLSVIFALALWQKAQDHLPFLLDEAARPVRRVSLADGIAAAMAFFVLQGIILVIVTDEVADVSAAHLLFAFALAGIVASGATWLILWRSRAQGMPVLVRRPLTDALAGLGGGVVAAAGAIAYLAIITRWPALAPAVKRDFLADKQLEGALVALVVVAAPLCEEFIFRGLIFAGLRRSAGRGAAVLASAALFALLHPPIAIVPVFGLGLVTALLYEWRGALLAPIVAHAVYNAAVVAGALLGLR